MEIPHNLPIQIDVPAKRLNDVEDPGSEHKALIELSYNITDKGAENETSD